MPSLGPAEILVVLVIALLVFGPDKMPDMARQAGRAFREFRRVQQHLRSEIHGAMGDLTSSDAPAPSPGGDPAPTLPPKDTPQAVAPADPSVPPGDDTTTPPPAASGPEPGSA